MSLSQLVYETGKLTEVSYFSKIKGDNDIQAVLLVFEATSCFIRVVTESDEIELLESVPENYLLINGKSNFKGCIGNTLNWAWMMTNQQGYQDGIRLEFSNSVTVELIAMASCLNTYAVSEI